MSSYHPAPQPTQPILKSTHSLAKCKKDVPISDLWIFQKQTQHWVKVHPRGFMEAEVRHYFERGCEPKTAYEVAAGIVSTLSETEVALDSLVHDGSLVYKEVCYRVDGNTEGSCARLYWHGNAAKASQKVIPSSESESSLQLQPSQLSAVVTQLSTSATLTLTQLQPSSPTLSSPSQQLQPLQLSAVVTQPSTSATLSRATLTQLQPSSATLSSPSQQLPASTASPSGMQPPSKRSRMPFKSPARMLGTNSPTPRLSSRRAVGKKRDIQDVDVLAKEVVELRRNLEEVEGEMGTLENYSEEELQAHIDKLHEYNEVKDMGQLLLGKLAEVEGATTAALYEQFGLGLED